MFNVLLVKMREQKPYIGYSTVRRTAKLILTKNIFFDENAFKK